MGVVPFIKKCVIAELFVLVFSLLLRFMEIVLNLNLHFKLKKNCDWSTEVPSICPQLANTV